MKTNEFPTPKKKLSPLQSIRFYCRWICCANDTVSWINCSVKECVLWRYRRGVGNLAQKRKQQKKTPSTRIRKQNNRKLGEF